MTTIFDLRQVFYAVVLGASGMLLGAALTQHKPRLATFAAAVTVGNVMNAGRRRQL